MIDSASFSRLKPERFRKWRERLPLVGVFQVFVARAEVALVVATSDHVQTAVDLHEAEPATARVSS